MKRCSRCKEVKPLSEFGVNKRAKDGHRSDCKTCCRAYAKGYYASNAAKVQERIYGDRERMREVIRERKDVPCTDCGQRYPHYVMQFDHLGGKLHNIGDMPYTSRNMEKLLAELEKCEVVCANCHAARTWNRKSELTPASVTH